MLKKVISILVSSVVLLSMTSLVYASDIKLRTSDEAVSGKAKIVDEATKSQVISPRINSSGKFTFEVSSVLTSDSFTITSSSITITANATTTTTTANEYTIVLYGKGCGLFGKSVTYTAEGSDNSYTFTGLTEGATYYFKIMPNISTGKIIGRGSISNFGKVV